MTNKERREKKQRNKREIKKTYREWLATQPPAIALYKQKENCLLYTSDAADE